LVGLDFLDDDDDADEKEEEELGFFPGGIVEAPRGPLKIFKEIIKIIIF
jgi:hypothetical protein